MDMKSSTTKRKGTSIKTQLRRMKTVNDLLSQDDINQLLYELAEIKPDIKNIVIAYETQDEYIHYRTSSSDRLNNLGLLDFARHMLLEGDDE